MLPPIGLKQTIERIIGVVSKGCYGLVVVKDRFVGSIILPCHVAYGVVGVGDVLMNFGITCVTTGALKPYQPLRACFIGIPGSHPIAVHKLLALALGIIRNGLYHRLHIAIRLRHGHGVELPLSVVCILGYSAIWRSGCSFLLQRIVAALRGVYFFF